MKGLLTASVLAVTFGTTPAMAETWVYAATSQGTYQSGANSPWGASQKAVHYVDVASIVSVNGLRYFNRKIVNYKLVSGEWKLQYTTMAGNSRANCSRGALMLTSPESEAPWTYRMNGNQWWKSGEIQIGSRSTSPDIRLTRLLGFNNYSELQSNSDRLNSGYYRIACGN